MHLSWKLSRCVFAITFFGPGSASSLAGKRPMISAIDEHVGTAGGLGNLNNGNANTNNNDTKYK